MEKGPGCAFNPRPAPGRCIKDMNYGKIDSQCEIVNGTCKLSSSQNLNGDKNSNINTTVLPLPVPSQPIKSSTLPLPPASPKKSTLPLPPVNPNKIYKSENKNTQRLSGPVSAYITQIGDKKYEFMGDIHRSMKGTCSKPCQDIMTIDKVNLSDPKGCWDISVFLSAMFTEAAKEGKWIDFYLEIPFLKSKAIVTKGEVAGRVAESGYLYKLFYIFYNCFRKTDCDFSTTRFHYVDVRQEYEIVTLPQLVNVLDIEVNGGDGGIKTTGIRSGLRSYDFYLSEIKIEDAVNQLAKMIIYGDKSKNKTIEEVSALMRDLYFSGGQTMKGRILPKNIRLFNLYLTSDNFYDDVKALMKESLAASLNPVELLEVLVPPNFIVNRKGKTMHRVRAQLHALEEEGKGDIANKIVSYLTEEYEKEANTNRIIDLWRAVESMYAGQRESKLNNMTGARDMIERLRKEMENISEISINSVSAASLLMDGYVLGRMFRTYPNKKHVDSYKSIVYAGEAHILTYVRFFKEYLNTSFIEYAPNKEITDKFIAGTVTKQDVNNITRCIPISSKDF